MAMAGVFAAVMAVLSQLSIPLPTPVPLTMSLFAVFLIATALAPRLAVLAQAAYLMLGAAGLPVFAGFKGGIAALLGPTGGFLMAYVPMTLIIGATAPAFGRRLARRKAGAATGAGMGATVGSGVADAVAGAPAGSGVAGAAASAPAGSDAVGGDSGAAQREGAHAKARAGAGSAAAQSAAYALSYLLATALCYAFGAAWLMAVGRMELSRALAVSVLPFIPLDLLKIAACAAVAPAVRRALSRLPAAA
jgi:biotin transport system substrate-specific component